MKPAERRRARKFAVQAIYQWQMTQANVGEIVEQFMVDQDLSKTDVEYFRGLVAGVSQTCEELDTKLAPYLARKREEMDLVDTAILRLAMFELSKRDDVPYKVVINEAIELAKEFAAEDSHKYVNGVLDKFIVSQKMRQSN
ncbi:transcription antitermination factor NusB [Motilimonas pumila]|uniref:Transcription antitermination protein NusB n=1 Tax=Motilimonas pumila TaxID=2303987 RepID=A0A418YKP2_9GAMM|nr:transcription antitermination factor NusB [Motilimonas pumila]RJG51552.1 transcription antitermination factor NusB [Motilimonas pumila]